VRFINLHVDWHKIYKRFSVNSRDSGRRIVDDPGVNYGLRHSLLTRTVLAVLLQSRQQFTPAIMSVSKNVYFPAVLVSTKKLYNDFSSFNPFEPVPAVLKCLF